MSDSTAQYICQASFTVNRWTQFNLVYGDFSFFANFIRSFTREKFTLLWTKSAIKLYQSIAEIEVMPLSGIIS